MYCILPKTDYLFIEIVAIHEYVFSVPSIIMITSSILTFMYSPFAYLYEKLYIELFDFKSFNSHLLKYKVVLLIMMCAVRLSSINFGNNKKAKISNKNDPPNRK